MPVTTPPSLPLAPYLGFAVFGAFWGAWGAAIPAVRNQANINDGQLGTALRFVGVGALPAMLLAGRAVDRFGQHASAVFIAVLGIAGIGVATASRDQATLSIALAALGAASGATDVAINASASAAQTASGTPVVSRSHGTFSVAVVVFSLGTGGLLALGVPLVTPFAIVAALAVISAVRLGSAGPLKRSQPYSGVPTDSRGRRRWGTVGFGSLLVIGVLSAGSIRYRERAPVLECGVSR